MADGVRRLVITIAGESESAERALKRTGDAAETTEVRVEGFGAAFAKLGAQAGIAAFAVQKLAEGMTAAVGAVGDYNASIDLAERQLLGMTKSQQETAAALRIAREEADKGRGTYQELAGAMAGLSSVAKTAGMDLRDVTEIAEVLAAVNPDEGLKGATFALREAASGDMTSVIERFNLSRATINRLRAEGVPAIEAVRRAMAEMGYDAKFLAEVNDSSAKKADLLKGRLAELAAIGGEPIFDVLIKSADKLYEALKRPGGSAFVEGLAEQIETILSGNLLNDLATSLAEVWFLAGSAFNDYLKAVSFGKLNIDGPLKAMRDNIVAFEDGWKSDVRSTFAEAVANELGGKAPGSPLEAGRVRGYGTEVLRNYLAGFDADQVGALGQFDGIIDKLFPGDANREAASRARATLAAAIAEIEQFGRISDGTFGASEGLLGEYNSAAGQTTNTLQELTRVFGAQAPEVLHLLQLYRQQAQAQDGARVAAGQLATAQDQLAAAQERAAEAAARLGAAVNHARAVQEAHARGIAGEIAAVQREIQGVQQAAADQARASSAAIEGLQDDLAGLQARAEANQEASQARIAAAQAAQSAAAEARRRGSEIARAALAGETEEYLAQLDVIDEQARALAAKYEAIIGGERRARDAANDKVKGLGRAANEEDLKYLRAIQAARDAGNTKEAARLQREFDAAKKRRGGAMELARAEAAVAGDRFDQAAERLKKEQEAEERRAAKAEAEAGKRLAETQAQAAEQARADKAALDAKQSEIKAVQDLQRQQAQAASERQRQLQAEITRIEERGRKQAAEDQARVNGALAAESIGKRAQAIEVTHAGNMVTAAQAMAGAKERERDAARETFEWEEKRLRLYEQYGVLPRQLAPTAPVAPPNPTIGPNAGNLGGGGGVNASALRRDWDGIVRGGAPQGA